MDRSGVIYLSIGKKSLARLAVSLASLRQFYAGPIAVLAWMDEYLEVVARICGDKSIRAELVLIRTPRLKRHSHYLAKTLLHRFTPYDRNVFIDADTLPVAEFGAMWPHCREIVLTSFVDWTTVGRRMASRLAKWREVAPWLVERARAMPQPAINTGVFGFHKDAEIMEQWYELTTKNVIFMADELAMQLIFPDFPHRIVDDLHNYSPIYRNPVKDVKIYHFHGNKHLVERAKPIWLPAFQQCFARNAGKIQEWLPAIDPELTKLV